MYFLQQIHEHEIKGTFFIFLSNDHGRTHKCGFSVFDRKFPFWVNLVQKIKFVCLSWNLVPRLIRISRIQWWFFVNEGKRSTIIVSVTLRKWRLWNRQLLSTLLFCFVEVSPSVDCFWVLSLKFLNNLECRTENRDKLIYWFSTSSAVLQKSVLTLS